MGNHILSTYPPNPDTYGTVDQFNVTLPVAVPGVTAPRTTTTTIASPTKVGLLPTPSSRRPILFMVVQRNA